jgi:predicted Na+-dependent transporter
VAGAGRRLVARYAEVLWVVAAAALGLLAPGPGRTLAVHDAVDIVLAVLVFATALTVPRHVGERLRHHGVRLLAVTVAGSAVVLAIAWAVSHLVEAGPLRFGVLAVGVAPVEIATLGVAPLGGGDSLTSGVMVIGSTVLTALFAGPVMAVLADGASVHVRDLVVTLLLVVVAPVVVGLALRCRVGEGVRARASIVATVAVIVLVWLVASQAELSDAYLGVALALALLIVASAGAGAILGWLVDGASARSVVFGTSMRDFAIASGIAAAAFGTAAAAPLGLYGVMVMLWGTGLAGVLRARSTRA